MQILPSPALAQIVKHFLIIENDHTAHVQHRMFSDGNTGMVFNYGDPLIHLESHNELSAILPFGFIYGQLDIFQNIISAGKIGMLIVVFHPFGLSSLLKISAIELKNQILNLETFYSLEIETLLDQIFQSSDIFSKIQIVENFLTRKLTMSNQADNLAFNTIKLIHHHNGNLSVNQLTSILQISERKLQRTFEEHIGLPPKRYSGVIRIQYFLKLLRKSPRSFQTKLVYDAGFFDQAHLIREMKNISGITPSQYISQTNLLAANFLQIPEK
ncbi:helix-turn-helix transcriptional regulator [Dyadobacter frigoris]|uniref:Helix-turn-helix transcriptional regulator n=1 Tax=Dyadobacter frigoris TaxID=2576211 RepID=A0A4U6CXS2_9BACT|nr:helix-turn-helix transcriptional regulator [Dyadobacter frigoris]TKT88511.1 helix-turn-helix transcriptional regulator [Dyadobacter frigoris]GLU54556.1 AraC family transcriptional regulator [Dyadobacter frigoris]